MGEATIISSQGEGLYTVEVKRDHAYIDALLAKINERLAEIVTETAVIEAQKSDLETEIADIQSDLSDQIDIVVDRPQDIEIENAQRELNALIRKYNMEPPEATESEVDAARATLAALQAADAAADAATDAIRDLLTAGFELQAEYRDIVYQLAALKMESEGLTKKKNRLESEKAESDIRDVWCADYTENLTDDVPTCEINGELTDIVLYPGDCPAEEPTNHGDLVPVIGQTAAQAAFNFAIHPGWQKWKPTYRIGTITAINYDLNTCSVNLSTDNKSHYQNLVINQSNTLSDVPIAYMTCDAAAFAVDDRVLIRFDGQDWSTPRVIGFEREPNACNIGFLLIISTQSGNEAVAWSIETSQPYLYKETLPNVKTSIANKGWGLIIEASSSGSAVDYWESQLISPPSNYYFPPYEGGLNLPIFIETAADSAPGYHYFMSLFLPAEYGYTGGIPSVPYWQWTHYYSENPAYLDDYGVDPSEVVKGPYLVAVRRTADNTHASEFKALTGWDWPIGITRMYRDLVYLKSWFDFELDGYQANKPNMDQTMIQIFDSWSDADWGMVHDPLSGTDILVPSESYGYISKGLAETDGAAMVFEHAAVCFHLEDESYDICTDYENKRREVLRIFVKVDNLQKGLSKQIFDAINTIRVNNGLKPLFSVIPLLQAAKRHVNDMATVMFSIDHTGSDGSTYVSRVVDSGWTLYLHPIVAGWGTGENNVYASILPNEEHSDTINRMIQAWMGSPPHYANIMESMYTATGVAVQLGTDGNLYACQVFGIRNYMWPGFWPVDTDGIKDYIDENFNFSDEADSQRLLRVFLATKS